MRPSSENFSNPFCRSVLCHVQQALTTPSLPAKFFEVSLQASSCCRHERIESRAGGVCHIIHSEWPFIESSIATELSTGTRDLVLQRDHGLQHSKEHIYEQLANKQYPSDPSEFILRNFERSADGRVRATFYDGIRAREVSENAIEPKVGMTFMAGPNAAQVNQQEQIGMTQGSPDQKDAMWRVNTAGALLRNFEVDKDLSIIQSNNTSAAIAKARQRKSLPDQKDSTWRVNTAGVSLKNFEVDKDLSNIQSDNTSAAIAKAHQWNVLPDGPHFPSSSPSRAIVSRSRDDRTVTIDSENVHIVNDLGQSSWDLESTLIEVDGSSLTNLIVNYRHLIYRGGPSLTFAETVSLEQAYSIVASPSLTIVFIRLSSLIS